MEVKTMSTTSPDLFSISVTNGIPNYSMSFSKKALAAALVIGTATIPTSATSDSALIFGRQVPYVCIIGDTVVDTIPIAEKVQKVLAFYNLGKSHLCNIVGISRPALYAWIDGSSEPDVKNFAKVEQLYTISKELDIAGSQSIYHGYIDRPLPGESKSLYELFVENNSLESNLIKNLVLTALNKSIFRSENIANRRVSEFLITHSDAEEELNLERNL